MTPRGWIPIPIGVWLAVLVFLASSGRPAWSQQVKLHSNLANQLRRVEIRVVSGRITATTKYPGRSMSSNSSSNDRQERLSVNSTNAILTVHYELTTAQLRIALDLVQGDELQIRREPRDSSAVVPLEFSQPADGSISLTLGAAPEQKLYRAGSLWHLLMAEREVCRDELVPLLQLIRPGWQLIATADEVEEAMYRTASAARNYNRRAWSVLVEELGDNRFARRQAADRQLRESGQVVLPFLRTLDREALDAEQAYRVRKIIQSLSGSSEEDTPQSIAGWMVADPLAWYTLLTRGDAAKQQIAAQQIGRLLAEPVQFDPQADAATRKAQIERLRGQIERHAPRQRPSPAENPMK